MTSRSDRSDTAASRRRGARARSLRLRLTAVSTAVISVALALSAAVLVWRVQASLLDGVDSALSGRVRDVAAQAASGQISAVSSTGADSAELVQIINAHGRVLASSANINGEPALFGGPANSQRVVLRSESKIPSADPGTYRLAALAVSTPNGTVRIYAARSLADITASVDKLRAALLVGVPFLISVLGAIVWSLIGWVLRPVEALRQVVRDMPGNQPHPRLSDSRAPLELARLAATFDDLLDRVEASSAIQRRFLADAAHELRNPVAAIVTRLEAHRAAAAMPETDLAQLRADANRLTSVVNGLLSLARLDANTVMRRELVDLDDLVFDGAQTLVGKHVDLSAVSGAQVCGDRMALDRVVRNILENAARHAVHTITVALSDDGEWVTLVVADDGPGIPEADRVRVFERFTRLDEARSRDEGGTGLGLAIVHDIVDRHHGAVYVENNMPGARFVVRLPSAQPAV